MEPIAYWLPTDGTAKEKRRGSFTFSSTLPATPRTKNWNAFTHDPEWKRGVLEQPEFQRLLSRTPHEHFHDG